MAGYAPLHAGRLEEPLLAVGAVGIVLCAASLVLGRPGALPWGVVFLGAAYGASLFAARDDRLDPWAPLVAAGLLVVAELGYWSLEARIAVAPQRGVAARRLAILVAAAFGSMLAGILVLAAGSVRVGGGFGWDVLGVAAAVGALAVAAELTRRQSST